MNRTTTLWVVFAAVIIVWLLGLLAGIGPIVNLLLVVAAVIVLAQYLGETPGP